MLIKIKPECLEVVKHSMTVFENDQIKASATYPNVELSEGEHLIVIKGKHQHLYQFLLNVSRNCDIEIM